jgi:hypothetical protein
MSSKLLAVSNEPESLAQYDRDCPGLQWRS